MDPYADFRLLDVRLYVNAGRHRSPVSIARRRLDLSAPVVAGGFLPGPATVLGDASEREVALRRRDRSHIAQDRRSAWRYNHRCLKVTFGDCGVNADLMLQVRCAVYDGTFGSAYGPKFQLVNDASPLTGIVA
jgi:hypothetical protein